MKKLLLMIVLASCGDDVIEYAGIPPGHEPVCGKQEENIFLCVANGQAYTCVQTKKSGGAWDGRTYLRACAATIRLTPERAP